MLLAAMLDDLNEHVAAFVTKPPEPKPTIMQSELG